MTVPKCPMGDRHIKCAEMTYMGEPVVNIAESLGVTKNTVYAWRRREDVLDYMSQLRGAAQAATRATIVGATSAAASRIVELVGSSDQRVALAAAQDLLNRGGHPKGERLDLGGAVATTDMTPAQAAAAYRVALGESDEE